MRYPKGLIEVGGRTLIALQCAALLDRVDAVVVVAGWAGGLLTRGLPARVRVLRVARWWTGGQADSLSCAIEQIPVASVLVQPVDVPPAGGAVLDALLATGGDAVPTWQGHRGHPVLLGPGTAGRLAESRPDDGLRSLLRDAQEVAVDDERVTWNLNRPRDLARWLSSGWVRAGATTP
jgi:CTP:molybdopterin cytidylyltransferase MocA